MSEPEALPLLTRVVDKFLRGDLSILLSTAALVLGGVALALTPREEEPQIVVPMADVIVSAPGLSAAEVEQTVTGPLEQVLYQIDGVEYVYSMSRFAQSIVTVRFFVGEDREDSLVKLYNKIQSNIDRVPPTVSGWVVKPLEIDDVPILNVTLWSQRPELYADHELRRIAEQIQSRLQALPDANRVEIISGRPRQVRVELDAIRLAARQTSPLDVAQALRAANVTLRAGQFEQQDEVFVVDAGVVLVDTSELGELVINVADDRPVYLREVATILDGPAEPEAHSWIGFGPATQHRGVAASEVYPAVHVSVAKRKGSNAVWLADAVQRRLDELAATHLPAQVAFHVTRNYGETAQEKVNELVESLAVAVITVVALIGAVLGWRAALVIALAVPVCYGATLLVNMLAGYTINRVTMFALIVALGILVDDPITDVENISRYFATKKLPPRDALLRAVQEVRPALIQSTLAVVASFTPLFFITGMMGPYMAPMALNVPLTVVMSTIVAFLITPWMAMVALRGAAGDGHAPRTDQGRLYRFYRRLFAPVIHRRGAAWSVLGGVMLLLALAVALPALRCIPLKMLPYDNKNEFQLVIDMPEGTTLDRTDAVARRFGEIVANLAEVRDYQVYAGTASAMDFNGLVRHYFLRRGPHVAEVRVNLAPKELRRQQSHEIVLRVRCQVERLATETGANVKIVEVPPGPPVLSTITAEVYGPPAGDYGELISAARLVEHRLAREPLVVDVDTSAEAEQVRWTFVADKPKAALAEISTETIARTIELALGGPPVTILHAPGEVHPLPIVLRLPRAARSAIDDLEGLYVRGAGGRMVQLASLGRFVEDRVEQTIYHKNLQRVVYVYGEVAGRPPADAILDIQGDFSQTASTASVPATVRPLSARTWLSPGGGDAWTLPPGYRVAWAGEGEWKITLEVFRDLGLAMLAALAGIFVILMFETRSRVLPLVIMLAIPLVLIGIMPGFWLLNLLSDRPVGGWPNPVFFTATAMIGMIALAGIVVRNSVVLIDFIRQAQAAGLDLPEAIIQSVAVRTRPILLTAGTTLLGNWVITFDPIFSGLAWAIIFGLLASTLFTLLVIPTVYWLLYGEQVGPTGQSH